MCRLNYEQVTELVCGVGINVTLMLHLKWEYDFSLTGKLGV